jgi:protein-S-isoprenylcysteine O-methyltransferase Ste14
MPDLAPQDWLALQRAAFLAGPCVTACMLLLVIRPRPREAVAAMVGFLWQLPALLVLHMLATRFGWWSFTGERNTLVGLPIDLWIGWAIWWGPVMVFLNRWLNAWILIIASLVIDLVSMPRLQPMVEVSPSWLVGDVAAVALCLAPGLWFARLTRDDRNPKRRAMFHVLGWGGYMSLVIPVCVLSYAGEPLTSLYHVPDGALDWLITLAGILLLFVGIAATAEFARVGGGTPIPFDPPKSVVTSGPYAFVANPMQIISAFFMATLALYAGSWALGFIAAMFVIFDTIYATWYNRANIALSMPHAWTAYRGAVGEWRPSWRPVVAGTAEVVVSAASPSRVVWDWGWPWLSRRLGGDLRIRSAGEGEAGRLLYRRTDAGIEDSGVHALSRILEHGPAPLALLGWSLRFPYLGGALQRLTGLMIFVWRRLRRGGGTG